MERDEEARGRGPEPGEDEADDDVDPEAGVEVDIYEGASIKKRIGTLKDDANTLTHLLTHGYRNLFCESRVKAKMRHFRSKSGEGRSVTWLLSIWLKPQEMPRTMTSTS